MTFLIVYFSYYFRDSRVDVTPLILNMQRISVETLVSNGNEYVWGRGAAGS